MPIDSLHSLTVNRSFEHEGEEKAENRGIEVYCLCFLCGLPLN